MYYSWTPLFLGKWRNQININSKVIQSFPFLLQQLLLQGHRENLPRGKVEINYLKITRYQTIIKTIILPCNRNEQPCYAGILNAVQRDMWGVLPSAIIYMIFSHRSLLWIGTPSLTGKIGHKQAETWGFSYKSLTDRYHVTPFGSEHCFSLLPMTSTGSGFRDFLMKISLRTKGEHNQKHLWHSH